MTAKATRQRHRTQARKQRQAILRHVTLLIAMRPRGLAPGVEWCRKMNRLLAQSGVLQRVSPDGLRADDGSEVHPVIAAARRGVREVVAEHFDAIYEKRAAEWKKEI